ncbi:MAG: hypothetical protein M1495_13120 [Bacteroidetes bacterium]|nr:hypothetical protein [Bacteroidota bacterium]
MTWQVSILGTKWEICKTSFWRSSLEIRKAGYEMPTATFKRDGLRSRGAVSLPMGVSLKIIPHLFKKYCEITDDRDENLVQVKMKLAIGNKAEVSIEKKSEVIDKYPWTVMLAYIVALEQSRQARHH